MADSARAMKSNFGAAGLLEELIGKLAAMPPEKRAETEKMALEATAHMRWVPNPGPRRTRFTRKRMNSSSAGRLVVAESRRS